VLGLEEGAEFGDDFGILFRDVGGFGGVFFEVVEFQRSGFGDVGFRCGVEVRADGFPVAVPDALLAAVAGRFSVEGGAVSHLLAKRKRWMGTF